MKYFHAQNANRKIAGIMFDPYDVIAGTWVGVYATDDPALIDNLTSLAMSAASGVVEISEIEYQDALKKKAPFVRTLQGLNAPRVLTSSVGTQLKGAGRAVVVEEPVANAITEAKIGAETLDDVLQLEQISASPSPSQKQSKPKKI